MRLALTMRQSALAVALGAAATIGGALVFEHVFGYVPCKLCLMQRSPYYLAIPLGLAAARQPGSFDTPHRPGGHSPRPESR